MPRKEGAVPESKDEREKLKNEVAKELDLDDDVEKRGWENLTARETGKIGGNMVKKMMRLAEKEMDEKKGRIRLNDEEKE